jgi:hypothetical protein
MAAAGLMVSALWAQEEPASHGEPLSILGVADNENGFAIEPNEEELGSPGVRAPRVAGTGDVTGDGSEDILLGYPFRNAERGTAAVLFRKTLGPPVDPFDTGNAVLLQGTLANTRLSGTVSGLGDINGDSFPDFVVSPVAGTPPGPTPVIAYVIYGRPAGVPVQTNPAQLEAGNGGFAIRGVDVEDTPLGVLEVKGAGDVNADGHNDLLVHVPQGAGGAPARVLVVFGGPQMATFEVSEFGSAVSGFEIVASAPNAFWSGSTSFAAAGDVNGDGRDDIVVGYRDAANPGAGRAAVIFGKGNTNPVNLSVLGDAGFEIRHEAPAPAWETGWAVAGAGDTTGDGRADVLIGAPAAFGGAGAVYVVHGKTGNAPVSLTDIAGGTGGYLIEGRAGLNGRAGTTVAGAGDIDADGRTDILIGAPATTVDGIVEAGEAYLFWGREGTGRIQLEAVASDLTTSPTWIQARRYYGTYTNNRVGRDAAGVGDIHRTGLTAYAIAAHETVYVSQGQIKPFGGFENPNRPAGPTTAYRSFARPGVAPVRGVGLTDSVQEHYAFSRAWIGFTDGSSPSEQTVTLTRSNASIRNLTGLGDPANVLWRVQTNRSNFGIATLVFRYFDSEIEAIAEREADFSIFRAPAPTGPWTRLPAAGRDLTRNLISVETTQLGYFTVGIRTAPPVKPTGPSPFVGQVITVPDITLSWTPGAHTEEFVVYFGTPGNLVEVGTTREPSWPITGLVKDSQYAWRVDARSEVTTTTGDVWTFRTAPCRLPNMTQPVPANGATVPRPPNEVRFTATISGVAWQGPGCDRSFTVFLGTDNPPTQHTIPTGSATVAPIVGLTQPGQTVYWQVEVTNPDGMVARSNIWSFDVKIPSTDDVFVLTEFTDFWLSNVNNGDFDPPFRLDYTGFRHDPANNRATFAADFDGDKVADFAMVTEFNEIWISRFLPTQTVGPSIKQAGGFRIAPNEGHMAVVGDFNGDGLADALQVHPNGDLHWSINSGGSLPTPVFLRASNLRHNAPLGLFVIARDMNGDGRADLVQIDNVQGRISVALSTGTNFGTLTPWGTWAWRYAPEEKAAIHFGDFNGNNQTDALQVINSQMHIALNQDGAYPTPTFIGSVGFHDDPARGKGWWIFVLDVDRDGLDDLVQLNEFGEMWVSHSLGNGTFGTPERKRTPGFEHKPQGPWQVLIAPGRD